MRRLHAALLAPVIALAAACTSPSGPLIRIVNADSLVLDRVIVEAGGSEYALGRLLPGTAAQVRPVPAPDSLVQVRHHLGGPFTVRAPAAAGARLLEIRIHADSAGGVRTEPR